MSVILEQAAPETRQRTADMLDHRAKVSVLILNWNTRELTLQCIESLKQTLGELEAQIIVVDNGSTDGSAEAFAAQPDICLVRSPENLGFARGNNLGLPYAEGEYICLLNSDTIVLPGAVQRLVNYLDEHPEFAAAGGEHLGPAGEHLPSGIFFQSLWGDLSLAMGLDKFGSWLLKRKSPLARLWYAVGTREVDWLSNSFIVVRREVIEQVGPLPSEFFLYGEDVEWYWRMRQAGLRVAYVAGAPIIHLINQSSKQLYEGNEKSYRYLDAKYIFAARHRNPVSWRIGWLANALYWTVLGTRWRVVQLFTGREDAGQRARMLWKYARYHVDQVTGKVPPIPR